MNNRYRIEELYTTGWELIDTSCQNLTREECDQKLTLLIHEGRNPNYLRAVSESQLS
jgi:hypothetical protein